MGVIAIIRKTKRRKGEGKKKKKKHRIKGTKRMMVQVE